MSSPEVELMTSQIDSRDTQSVSMKVFFHEKTYLFIFVQFWGYEIIFMIALYEQDKEGWFPKLARIQVYLPYSRVLT